MNFLNPHLQLSDSAKRYTAILSFAIVLILWQAITASGLVGPLKLPSPGQVFHAFTYLAWDGSQSILGSAIIASVQRIFIAGALVVAVGIPLGVLMGSSQRVNAFISPLLDPFRSAPVVALLPLFVMWIGIGETMKISFLFVGAVVYMIPMVRDAVRSVPYSYWEGIRDLGGSHLECITKGVLPIAAPRIFDAAIVSTSILWTYITVAEYVNADSGLGQLIQNARRFSAMDQVLVGIFTIVVLALLTFTGLTNLKRKIYHWEGKQ